MPKPWLSTPVGADWHIFPLGDFVTHEGTDECVCGPRSEALEHDDGSITWLVVHNSLDGREAFE